MWGPERRALDRAAPEGVPAPTLSFVLPMWNEAEGAARALRECRRVGDALVRTGRVAAIEVIAVDDGSTDATASVVEDLASLDAAVRLVRHDQNCGIGAAIRTGLAATQGDLVAYTDADLPVAMDELVRAVDLQRQRDASVVAAHRVGRRVDGAKRRLYSTTWNALVRWTLGLRLVDVNFAFKLFDGPAVRDLDLLSTSVCIDAEILARMERRGGRIEQFPAAYLERQTGSSSVASLRSVADTLADLRRVRQSLRRTRR